MTSYVNEGMLAFPCEGACARGMTLRDYFIAHAPAEPQPWFEPVMDTDRPVYTHIPSPSRPDDLTNEEHKELNKFYGGTNAATEAKQPRVITYLTAIEEVRKQRDAAEAAVRRWEECKTRQRYIQWPAAWADAMLEQRNKG